MNGSGVVLNKKDIDFLARGNKFLHISDYQKAQALLNKQLDVRFAKMLDGFVPIVFPMIQDVLDSCGDVLWGRSSDYKLLKSFRFFPFN